MSRIGETVVFTSLVAFALLTPPGSQDTSTAVRMQAVLKRVVQETGAKILSVGSWISNVNYRDPLKGANPSDHDFRLLLPPGVPPDEANRTWSMLRQKIIDKVRAEFGKDAPRVLASSNFYAPSQLMRGVETQADALQRFVKLGQVPNLGYAGKVTASTPMKLAEGLYGPGAGAYTQVYERSAGRLFYTANGKVYSGMADLVHEGEGIAKYTVGGSGSTAFQWAAHAEEAMKANDPSSVTKYLARLERDLVKARDLARMPTNTSLRAELSAMAAKLRANPGSLASVEGQLTNLLRKAALEGALLSKFDRGGFAQKAALRVALDSLAAADSVGKALSAALEKVPADLLAQGVVTMISTYMTSRSLGERDYMSALNNISPLFVSLGPAVSMMIVQSILEGVKSSGYDFMANRQDAFDLLEGFYTGTGDIGERKYTIDQLVDSIHTEESLKAFVLARANQAADRGFGSATGRHDLATAGSIFARCYPIIHGAWQQVRDDLTAEALQLIDGIDSGDIQLSYTPNPAQPAKGQPLMVTVSVMESNLKLGEALARIRAILLRLLGPKEAVFAIATSTWNPLGEETSLSGERVFSFGQPGIYPIQYELMVGIGSASLKKDSTLSKNLVRRASIDVEILPTGAKTEPTPPPAGVASGVFPVTPYHGTQITYEIAGVSLRDQSDEAGGASAGQYRKLRFQFPLTSIHAKGRITYGPQNEVYGPFSSAIATIKVVVYPSDKVNESNLQAKLKAVQSLPAGLEIYGGGQYGLTRRTTRQISQGESLQFDLVADIRWINELPAELVEMVSVEVTLSAALNGGFPDVIVTGSGVWEGPKKQSQSTMSN